MGAEKVDLAHYKHYVRFGYIIIWFGFKPFTYEIRILQPWNLTIFQDKQTAEEFKGAIDRVLEFIEYLKEFNKNEVENNA